MVLKEFKFQMMKITLEELADEFEGVDLSIKLYILEVVVH
jgi:hypothetical protein